MEFFGFDFILLAVCFFDISVSQQPCPFNSGCSCDPDINGNLNVGCYEFYTFPTFSTYNDKSFASVSVSGYFTSIPDYAFFPLQTLSSTVVSISTDTLLEIGDHAFATVNPNGFASLVFTQSDMSVPTGAFTNLSVPKIGFYHVNLPTLADYYFNDLTTNSLDMEFCNMGLIQPNAFTGSTFLGEDSSLILSNNYLNQISLAFKNVTVSNIYLMNNSITEIGDFAFCGCNTLNACANNVMTTLHFDINPISWIADNAFANLPKLTLLSLASLKLISVPSTALMQIESPLQHLDLGYNQITNVGVNSFFYFTSIIYLSLDGNPITTLDPGCFNGLSQIWTLQFYNLNNLTTVDILIVYGMENIWQVALSKCFSLQSVTVSDITKLPMSLGSISLASNDIREISSDFQYWLAQSTSNSLDISGNWNFNCDNSTYWMAKFSCCSPFQIDVQDSLCAGTKQDLGIYLCDTFQPICN